MAVNWKKITRIAIHVAFWVSYLFFYSFLYGYRTGSILESVERSLYTLPIDIAITYFAIYYLIPKFLLRRKYVLYFTLLIASTLIAAILTRIVYYYYVYPLYNPEYDVGSYPLFSFSILVTTYNIYPVVLFASAVKLLKTLLEERYKRMDLEIQNKSSELALLRNQVNPHFLFNTLNNIHTLITKDSDKAADALMRLSEILRYMLYETTIEFVPVEKEMEYIESYIEIQKLRLTNPNSIDYYLNPNIRGYKIAPMLFIPFIENAFKHSDKNNLKVPIVIKLDIINNILHFETSNSIKNKDETLDKIGGIGLKNVKRRLEILYFNKYKLDITTDNSIFKVQLAIDINEN